MEDIWVLLTAPTALVLATSLALIWRRFRAHALKRWLKAMDAYAEGELARERSKRALKAI